MIASVIVLKLARRWLWSSRAKPPAKGLIPMNSIPESNPAPPPPPKFSRALLSTVAGKIGFAVVVSLIGGFITKLPYLPEALRWFCQIVVWVFTFIIGIVGKPDGAGKIENKPDPVLIRDVAKASPLPLTVTPRIPFPEIVTKKKEEVVEKATEKVTAKVVEPIKEGAEKAATEVKEGAAKIVGEVVGVKKKLADSIDDYRAKKITDQITAEEIERKQLVARCRELGVACEDDWPLISLQKALAEQYKTQWYGRFNAQCPNPRCRKPMKLSASAHGRHVCSHCKASFVASDAKRKGPPPVPKNFHGF